jgi:hypothetical protein
MKLNFKRAAAWGMGTTLMVALIAFAVMGVAGIVGWEYTNSNQFCATMCHSVHPEEIRANTTSSHANVKCVECHMGRLGTLHLMALKPTHLKELWGMIAGYERPTHAHALRPARDNCEGCHWPSAEHHDSLALKKRYATDEDSSETINRILIHTAVGIPRVANAKGVHWHIDNEVTFVATDHQRREIPWVQVKDKDGKVTTYTDVTKKLTEADLAKHEKRRMECFDCHNQAGHPLSNPSHLVDEALATGRIDRENVKFAKKRAEELIAQAAKISGPYEEVKPKFAALVEASALKGELTVEQRAAEKGFQAEMTRILATTSFNRPELSWKSFPDHGGHNDTPGCFRCHDGKHQTDKGQAIRLQCTLCHDLPQVTRESGKGSVPSTTMAGMTPPDSHSEPNFMHDHRMKFDQSCTMCHGKNLEFGREGGNFCANPACHGRKWPGVNLSAKANGGG